MGWMKHIYTIAEQAERHPTIIELGNKGWLGPEDIEAGAVAITQAKGRLVEPDDVAWWIVKAATARHRTAQTKALLEQLEGLIERKRNERDRRDEQGTRNEQDRGPYYYLSDRDCDEMYLDEADGQEGYVG